MTKAHCASKRKNRKGRRTKNSAAQGAVSEESKIKQNRYWSKSWTHILTLTGVLVTLISIVVTVESLVVPQEKARHDAREEASQLMKSADAILCCVDDIAYTEVNGDILKDILSVVDRAASVVGEDDLHIRLLRAKYLLAQGLDDQAADAFRLLRKEMPNSAEPLEGLGLVLRRKGKPEDAIVLYEEAIAHNSKNTRLLLELSLTFTDVGDYSQASKAAAKALSLDPLNSAAHIQMGIVYESMGKVVEARQAYETALQHNEQSSAAHECLGILSLKEGSIREAVLHLRDAVKLNPSNYRPHLGLAIAYYRIGDVENAIEEVEYARARTGKFFSTEQGYVRSFSFPAKKESLTTQFDKLAAKFLLELRLNRSLDNLRGFENIFLVALEFADSPADVASFENVLSDSCIAVGASVKKLSYKFMLLLQHKDCLQRDRKTMVIVSSKILKVEEEKITESLQDLVKRMAPYLRENWPRRSP